MKIRNIVLSPAWAILLLVGCLYALTLNIRFIESVKLNYFDSLILSGPITENNIHVVNIDEATLDKYGQFPFSRDVYGEIIKEIYSRGAGLVIFNIMMPEADRLGKDAEFVEALKLVPTIMPIAGTHDKAKNVPPHSGSAVINSQYLDRIFYFPNMIANIEDIQRYAYSSGVITTFPEIDGVTRRLPLFIGVGDDIYPSLALETVKILAGADTLQVKLSELGVEKVRIKGGPGINVDEVGRMWIDWQQRADTWSYTEMPMEFENGIVIVGVNATGLGNPVATPKGGVYPSDVQAAALGTLANGVNIQRPAWATGAELLTIGLVGLLLIGLSRWVYVGVAFTAISIGAAIYGSQYYYAKELILFDGFTVAAVLTLVALHAYSVKFIKEFLEKQEIKKQFAGYCSPEVVKILQEHPELVKDGIKKDISICFSDLRGFTNLGEKYGDDVKGLTEVMNGYMDAITQPVLDAKGMIIKYIGDASMHIHNAPVDDPNHAHTAVKTGLNMLAAVEKYNEYLDSKGIPRVGMGAGINTGFGFIGEMGSTSRHAYDVLGDAVSTTARLESQCKNYGVLLIVGPETYHRTKDEFFYLKLDDLAVKGKSVGLSIYTVLRACGTAVIDWDDKKEIHDEMHERYVTKQFESAIFLCNELKGSFNGQMDKYYDMWIERCEFMKTQDLPVDWNGVFVATTK